VNGVASKHEAQASPSTVAQTNESAGEPSARKPWWQRLATSLCENRRRISAIVLSVAITVTIVALREQIGRLSGYGYLGVFVISVLGNATVILPVPSLAVVFAGGGVLQPLVVGLVAGVGEPLGELTGYLAGYGGSVVLEDVPYYRQVRGWMENHGMLTIFVLAAIPNPLFDLAGISAGALHMPVAKFLVACWLGKTLKAIVVAYLGSVAIGLFEGILAALEL